MVSPPKEKVRVDSNLGAFEARTRSRLPLLIDTAPPLSSNCQHKPAFSMRSSVTVDLFQAISKPLLNTTEEKEVLRRVMGDTYVLLVLAEPPQSAAIEDLQLAFQPTVNAVTDRLSRPLTSSSAKNFLDVALPVTRITKEASSQSELLLYLSQVLTGIYQLFDIASSNHPLTAKFETTVVLVYEKQEHIIDDYGRSFNDQEQYVLPTAFRDLEVFARSPRPWSRIFQVDSLQGDRIYQKLRNVSGASIPTALHEKVVRLPAGIQMYIPPAAGRPTCTLDNTPPRSNDGTHVHQTIAVNVESDALKLEDKVTLTMSTMTHSGVVAVLARGQPEASSVVLRFWESLLGARMDKEVWETSTGVQTWESTLSDGTLLSVSSPIAPKLTSTMAKQQKQHVAAVSAALSS
jgi:hypothetical protein